MVIDLDRDILITHIFNSTDKGLSIYKAEKYAQQLINIASESYPNVDRHSFLVEKVRLLIQQLKQSIQRLKQLDDAMILLAKQLDCFEKIYSIPGIGELSASLIYWEMGGDSKIWIHHRCFNACLGSFGIEEC